MMILYPYGLRKALTLSYDDGVETDIELVRILDQRNIVAVLPADHGKTPRIGAPRIPDNDHRITTL